MAIATSLHDVTHGVLRMKNLFVNLYFLGTADAWVLIDAGLPGSADAIIEAASDRFGKGNLPQAIILTHGHFDHVGSLAELLDKWHVPVYAHEIELAHLTGKKDYPKPDPTVGKGAMALLSFAYPEKAIDLGDRVKALPEDYGIPGMNGWRWIHTPGHADGQVSLFQDEGRLLIAGDAFVTVQQESLYKVATQKKEVHGPPSYFTPDWIAAEASVRALAALHPTIAATGHGTPMSGEDLARGLTNLVENFDKIAVPGHGRYVP